MVILFSSAKSAVAKEITDILTAFGGSCISDKAVNLQNGKFTVICEHKTADLKINKGIAVIADDTDRFKNQVFPEGIIGICESGDKSALEIFEKNRIPVITCGMSGKNTVTFSSMEKNRVMLTLQRTVIGMDGTEIEPGEYKIELKREYNPFSVLSCTAILLLFGIVPQEY